MEDPNPLPLNQCPLRLPITVKRHVEYLISFMSSREKSHLF